LQDSENQEVGAAINLKGEQDGRKNESLDGHYEGRKDSVIFGKE
jgi:hypothetical protein